MGLTSGLAAQVKRHPALHRWALRAWSLRHPPPFRRPNMEFEFDAWNGISSLHNQVGRQIGEDNTGPYPYRDPTFNQYETCRFKDSRLGLPMNVTNLRLVMPDAGPAYQLVTELRNRYIAQRRLAGPRLNLIQAYLFSKFAVSLPAYLVRRRERPVRDGQLQALETAFYMLGTAPFMMVRQLMVRGDPRPLDPQPMSGEALYALSDACGVLISTRARACPASPKLIVEFFDVIMNGGFSESLDSPQVRRVLDTLGDWDRFYAYALASSRLELLIKLNQALTAQALLSAQSDVSGADAATHALRRAALDGALQRSYVRAADDEQAAAVLNMLLEVLRALLRDHEEHAVLDALDALHGARSAGLHDTAQRIRQGNTLVLQACRRNLMEVHRTLGQTGWPSIGEADLLRRSGGADLPALLDRMEPAAAA